MAEKITAYIGLGSNLGERQAYINVALKFIDSCEGVKLLRVSDIIETVALGEKDASSFFNAVAEIETTLSAEKLLKGLFEIEHSLGRERGDKWAPRTMDLDLLLYGDKIIRTADLVVPHSQMHLRTFVLKGLCELNGQLVHPVLKRSMKELAARLNGGDFAIEVDRPQLISVAGLIGVGKTTLAKNLAGVFKCGMIAEAYDTNPYLAEVYAGKTEKALDSQLYFFESRVRQLNKESLRAGEIVVSDYIFEQEQIYSRLGLDAEQFESYRKNSVSSAETVVKAAVVIYLKDSVENCLERIQKRNRPYEQKITVEFLRQLSEGYERLFEKWDKCPVVTISADNFDCRDIGQVEKLADELKNYIAVK